MKDASWLKKLGTVLDAAEGTDGSPAQLRSLLYGTFRLIETGGHRVQITFEALSEHDLIDRVRTIAETLSGGRFNAGNRPNDLASGVLLAGRLLRALELAMTGLGILGRGTLRSRDYEVRFGADRGWLLPFPPRFRGPPKDWPPYFVKRGLTRFRCIPGLLSTGHSVDLHIFDGSFGGDLRAAACAFETLILLDQNGEAITADTVGPFVVSGLAGRAPSPGDLLQESVSKDGGAQILIFPELSIDAADRTELVRILRTRPWDLKISGSGPSLVLAGSWHDRREDGQYLNVAPVFDKYGNLLGRHSKHALYGSSHGAVTQREGVTPSDKVLVLASRSLTLGFAICLDFCQSAKANPYDELDVDLVLVTSLANETTTEKHRNQAIRIWDRRKTGTFLVQQNDVDAFGVSGAHPSDDNVFKNDLTEATTIRKIFTSG